MKEVFLSELKEQKKNILKAYKSFDAFKLINFYKYYNIDNVNRAKIINNLIALSKDSNVFFNINLLIVSNLSFRIFDRIIKEKLVLSRITANIFYKDYNSIFTEKNNNSEYHYIIIFPDINDFLEISNFSDDLIYKKKDLKVIEIFYTKLLDKAKKFFSSKIFLCNFSYPNNSELGNFTLLTKNNKFDLINKLNTYLLKLIKKNKLTLIDNFYLSSKFGLNIYKDLQKFYLAKIPFSQIYSEFFFTIISNLISISSGRLKKVLVLDLDGTLWGGILGDDGYKKIILDNQTPVGIAHSSFQRFILNLKKRGVLLAICSKNDKKNVLEAFERNANMILSITDFASIQCNWENKVDNIKKISKELNLNLDSFVFFDDNPVERELVRTYLPQVDVPETSEDPSYFSKIIADSFLFDLASFTKEDLLRSNTYIANNKREILKDKFNNINDYLRSLDMKAEVSFFKKDDYQRIQQLFLRSNQFNMTTIRYTERDIVRIANDSSYVTLQFNFSDKFSKYGIISMVVAKIVNNDLIILNWVMSCRVLNRTLEAFIMNKLFKICNRKKLKSIVGEYKFSEKNSLVSELYKELGFNIIFDSNNYKKFSCNISKYKSQKTYVKEA